VSHLETNGPPLAAHLIMRTTLTALLFILMISSTPAHGSDAQSCKDLFISQPNLVVNPLLGIVKEPNLQTRDFYKNLIFGLKSESQFPSVHESELQIQAQLNVGGRGNKNILLATYHTHQVIVKISDPSMRSEENVLNEARWLMFLNKFNLGPEFYGLRRTTQGELAIVMQFIDGEAFSLSSSQVKIPITKLMIFDIRKTGFNLKNLGIAYAPDLQFMLTKEGHAQIIDVEYFRWSVPLLPPFDPKVMPYDPVQNTEALIEKLRIEAAKQIRPEPAPKKFEGLILISK
jgi:predicted Ser/Thr protein kinase